MATYTYSPLATPRSIRLAKLNPASSRAEQISCDLIHASLDSCPEFEALSYTWGDASITHQVSCSGSRLDVTTSLLSAFQHLRHTDSVRLVWVDAICINQASKEERYQQVQLMRDIYHQAKEVLVWLGPACEDSSQCLPLVPMLAGVWEKRDDARQARDEEFQGVLGSQEAKELGLPELSDPIWEALKRVLHRPWFDRVWVIQEVAVSKRATIICGDAKVIWEDLLESALLISEGMIHGDTEGPDVGNITTIDGFRIQVRDGEEFDLFVLLKHSRPSLATDARDKVYALLGIAQECDRDAIKPDYGILTAELYRRITLYFIERDKTTDVLSQAGYGQSIAELPSWAPDWSLPISSENQDLVDVSHPGYWLDVEEHPVLLEKSKDPNHLILGGKIVDTILEVGPVFDTELRGEDASTARERIESVIRKWESLVLSMQSHTTGEAAVDAYWRTLVAGADKENEEAPPEYGYYFALWYKQFSPTALDLSGLHEGEISMDQEEAARLYGSCVRETCGGRRLFITAKGHMGVGMKGAMEGDLLAVLSGGAFPYLLRSDEQCYTVVGECYTHGLDLDGIMADQDLALQYLTLK